MDDSAYYAFGAVPLVLSFPAMVGSVVVAIRTRQFYGRYALIFLAATFTFVRMATYLPVVNKRVTINTSNSELMGLLRGGAARSFFYNMFVPLLYCVFLEVCRRTIIVNVPPTTNGASPSKPHYQPKLFSIYVAYLWTIILICTNIVYNVMTINMTQSTAAYSTHDLFYLNYYSTWVYFLLALLQISTGFNQLRHCITSLSVFLFAAVVSNIGHTVSSTIISRSVSDIVDFVLMDLVGIFGLWFALWASPRYWIPRPPKQTPTTNQPQYVYYAPTSGMIAPAMPQPQQTFAYSTGSSPQVQQQYPVVQIPQQQLQPGQYPIVQIPISLQQQNGQYPIVNFQPTTAQ